MKTKLNRLNSLFGPAGSFAGLVILAAGVVTLYYSFNAIILILFGAFVGLSYEGTKIDFEKKRVKPLLLLFGFVPLGRWWKILGNESLHLIPSTQRYRTYSRSNRTTEISQSDYRLIMEIPLKSRRIVLQKFKDKKEAQKVQEEIRQRLVGGFQLNTLESSQK
jgi:hypothetical protein